VNTQIAITTENNVTTVGVTDESEEYLMWQIEEGDEQNIHFEYNDQINSGYNNIKEITLMLDGIHLEMSTGELVHFYFNNLSKSEYLRFVSALEGIYSSNPEILEVIDK
jgi:hypothetical protein